MLFPYISKVACFFHVQDSSCDIQTQRPPSTLRAHPHGGLHAAHLVHFLVHDVAPLWPGADTVLDQTGRLLHETLLLIGRWDRSGRTG